MADKPTPKAPMQHHSSIKEAIRLVRSRLQREAVYVRGELRTKQVLIEPILRALGWDTADPSRVRMEHHRPGSELKVDYALMGQDYNMPRGIVEAKALESRALEELLGSTVQHNQRVQEAFRQMREGEPWELLPGDRLLEIDHPEKPREAHEAQLESYVRALGMTSGYAVLTNGDEWRIYDLTRYALGNNGMRLQEATTDTASILLQDAARAAQTIGLLHRARAWPERNGQ